jgi:hypothetical protein
VRTSSVSPGSRLAAGLQRAALALWLGFGVVLTACGHGKTTVNVDAPDDPRHEDGGSAGSGGSHRDAATDAAMADGAVASADAARGDAGMPAADGGADDAGPAVDPTRACDAAVDNSMLELPLATRGNDAFSLAIGVTGFGIAYQAPGCGVIGAMPVAADGAFGQPNMLLGDCFAIQDLALLHVSDGWRVAVVDNSLGNRGEVQTLTLPESLSMPDNAVRTPVTMNTLNKFKPVLASVAGVPHLAWISEDPATGKRQIDRKRFDDQGAVVNVLSADAGWKPVTLAFVQMASANAALAFVDEQGKPGIWLQALDKTVKPVGDPVLVSNLVTAGNSVDVATRDEDGGAILYSVDVAGVNHEIRFRRLDRNGALLGDESKVVGSPLQARDASLARLGGGYVVGYRQMPTTSTPTSQVRLMFITKEGNVMHDSVGRVLTYLVAETTLSSGPVTLRVSTDGQVLVAFLDGGPNGNQLRLVRKRLDCGL